MPRTPEQEARDPEGADDLSGVELAHGLGSTHHAKPFTNPQVPIEQFDFTVTDECRRSIYNLWRAGIDLITSASRRTTVLRASRALVSLAGVIDDGDIGWFNADAACASRRKRRLRSGSWATSREITFTAAFLRSRIFSQEDLAHPTLGQLAEDAIVTDWFRLTAIRRKRKTFVWHRDIILASSELDDRHACICGVDSEAAD